MMRQPRLEHAYQAIAQVDSVPPGMADYCLSKLELTRAMVMGKAGRRQEAARHFAAYQKTEVAKSGRDWISPMGYYESIGDVENLLYIYNRWDSLSQANHIPMSTEYQGMLGMKVAAEMATNRQKEALKTAERIVNDLKEVDSLNRKDNADQQMSMVPSVFPDRADFDLYASMVPAREVGGDLYDYLLLDHQLYFCLGDVSGKGVPASLFMAQTTRLFRALAKQRLEPATLLTRLNEELAEDNEQGMFCTMFVGLIDLNSGRLDYCNAGHNPPVIGGGQQHGEFLEMLPNAPVGLCPGLEYEGESLADVRGRALFIYTDGLNEAENQTQEQYGDDRLLAFLQSTEFESARQVIEALTAEVEVHRAGAEPNDDLTMMCLRMK